MLFHYRLRRFTLIDGVDLLKPTLSFACFFLLPVVKEHHHDLVVATLFGTRLRRLAARRGHKHKGKI